MMGKIWDRFLYRLGVAPRNYVESYIDDAMKVFKSIERFTVSTQQWANMVSNRIGISFPGSEEEKDNDSGDDEEKVDKGMYG